MKIRNDFKAFGRLVSIKELNKNLVVVTLVSKNSQDAYPAYPAIVCQKSLLPKCKDHSYLEITGYIGIYNTRVKQGIIPVQRLYATSVKNADTVLYKEFGVKGRFWEPKPCMLYVSGVIESIFADRGYMRYTIRTEIPEENEPVSIQIDWKKIDRHPEFKPGDKICAVCKITTPKKSIGTEERIFMNLNVFDMDYYVEQ